MQRLLIKKSCGDILICCFEEMEFIESSDCWLLVWILKFNEICYVNSYLNWRTSGSCRCFCFNWHGFLPLQFDEENRANEKKNVLFLKVLGLKLKLEEYLTLSNSTPNEK